MKKYYGVAASLTLCMMGGAVGAKNLDVANDNTVAIGTTQAGSVVSTVVLSQPIEGQYSSGVAVAFGPDHGAIQGGGHAIQGGGHAIQGGGHAIQGGGHAIQGGGHAIQGGGHAIQGGGHAIQGGGHAIQGGGHAIQGGGHAIQGGGHAIQGGGH